MLKRPMSYALSLAAGTALLALVAGSAGAMTLPGAAAQQASSPVFSGDAPKVENVWWRGPGWGWGWRGPGWGWRGPGWGWRGRGWCYWHPRACGW